MDELLPADGWGKFIVDELPLLGHVLCQWLRAFSLTEGVYC